MATLGVWFCICLTIVILSNESERTVLDINEIKHLFTPACLRKTSS